MEPFKKLLDAYTWVESNSKGPVCVLHANARIYLNPWCRGDMRLLEVFSQGVWQ